MSAATAASPAERRWRKVALAFQVGGYVSSYDADAYLGLTRGTCRAACLAGDLAYSPRPRGRKTRYMIRAQDADALFGAKAKAVKAAKA